MLALQRKFIKAHVCAIAQFFILITPGKPKPGPRKRHSHTVYQNFGTGHIPYVVA